MKRLFSFLLVFTLFLASCSTLEVGIETPIPREANPRIEDETISHPIQVGEPTPANTKTPYTGLVYRLGDALFKVGDDGQPVTLAAGLDPQILPNRFTPRAVFSPDGKHMLSWWDWSDLWLVDLATGQSRNLTNSPTSDECCAQFWPGRPGVVIFLTRSTADDGLSYQMASINLDGSDYRILDQKSLTGLPALAPDGSAIAYDPEGKPALYRWDGGPETFSPAAYGLTTSSENYGLTNPSWSPTGQHVAWAVNGDLTGSGKPQGGALVFDLQTQTQRLLHPYEPMGSGGGFLPPVWSPDGKWLAIFAHALNQPGVWLTPADGSSETLVYSPATVRATSGLQAFWSYDSQRLLVLNPNTEGDPGLTFFNLSTRQNEASPLPAGAIPLAWLP